MQFVSGIVVFMIIWWVVIFCVLPFGVARTYNEEDHEEEGYVAPGSPPVLNMKKKLVITTLISAILWIIVYFIIDAGIIDFREIARNEEL